MTMTASNEIAELRRQHEALGAQIARLEGLPAKAAPDPRQGQPVIERSVSFTFHGINPDPRMPSDNELNKLIQIVFASHPRFAPNKARHQDEVSRLGAFRPDGWDPAANPDHRLYFSLVWLAFRWQLTRRRTDIDLTRTLGFWVSECNTWLFSNGRREETGYAALMVALIAAGDIGFLDIETYYPNMMHVGLVASGEGGRATNASSWRAVLAQGKPPQPSNIQPRQYEIGRGVTVRQG